MFFVILKNEFVDSIKMSDETKQVTKELKDKNGVVRFRSQEVDGVKHGLTEIFDSDGKLKESCEYCNGKKHGLWQSYNFNKLASECVYVKGLKQGVKSIISGSIRIEVHFVNDVCHLETEYCNGTLTYRFERLGDQECGLQECFHANGNIQSRYIATPEGDHINMQIFDENGKRIGN